MNAEPGTKLTHEQIERLISYEMTAGLEYVYGPDNISADRDRNYDYYRGIMPDLPSMVGRSKVVVTTVANYIGLMKPSLLRIFTSGRDIAQYVSPKKELQKVVRLITRYMNDVVFRKDNRGELILNDWAEDGLVQKMGTIKGYWEERFETKDQILENIDDHQLVQLAEKVHTQGAEIVEHSSHPPMPDGAPLEFVPGRVHSVKVRTKVNKSQLCFDVIPPEEYIISRDARNDDNAVLEGHRTGMMVGDLIEMGYPADVINALPSYTTGYPDRIFKYNQDQITMGNRDASPDAMLRKVGVIQGILKCDYDGTGIKDWYIMAGGQESSPTLLEIQPYNHQVFFANFCPEPRPHTVYGSCPADRLSGIQKADTVLVRGMLDSLYLAITPQREVVMDWIVKPDQLMNMAPGAPVLVKQPNAIREIAIPFVGAAALEGIKYFEGQSEITTGVSRVTGGLDPDALQNQSATASANQRSAMDGRVEMVARIWSQGGMRKLFAKGLKCVIAHQDFERVVQIDGEPQTISPDMFEGLDDIDVNINTGLGTGNRERDYAMLGGILAVQKEMIEKMGPTPMVDFKKIVNTLQLQAESAGINYPENFFGDATNPDGSDWQPKPDPPQPSPDTVLLSETENNKTAAKSETDANQLEFDREKAVADIASRERVAMDKNARDYDLGLRQLGIEHANTIIRAAAVDGDMIRADMEKARKDEKKEPNIVIHSDAKDGIEAALGEVKGIASEMRDSHAKLHQEVAKMNRPKRIVRDASGKASHTEAMP